MPSHHASVVWTRTSADFTYDTYNRAHEVRFKDGAITLPGKPTKGIRSPEPRFAFPLPEPSTVQSCGVWQNKQPLTTSVRYFPRARRAGVLSNLREPSTGRARGPMNGRHPMVNEIPVAASRTIISKVQPIIFPSFFISLPFHQAHISVKARFVFRMTSFCRSARNYS